MKNLFISFGVLFIPLFYSFSDKLNHIDQQAEIQENVYFASPQRFISFEEFEKEFRLEKISTEQMHPLTKSLSQTMHKKIEEGLSLLLDVDEQVIKGVEIFAHKAQFNFKWFYGSYE